MIEVTVRSFSEKTQNGYLRHVETLAAFLGRSPDTVTGDDISLCGSRGQDRSRLAPSGAKSLRRGEQIVRLALRMGAMRGKEGEQSDAHGIPFDDAFIAPSAFSE
jgi:hypothetical protein